METVTLRMDERLPGWIAFPNGDQVYTADKKFELRVRKMGAHQWDAVASFAPTYATRPAWTKSTAHEAALSMWLEVAERRKLEQHHKDNVIAIAQGAPQHVCDKYRRLLERAYEPPQKPMTKADFERTVDVTREARAMKKELAMAPLTFTRTAPAVYAEVATQKIVGPPQSFLVTAGNVTPPYRVVVKDDGAIRLEHPNGYHEWQNAKVLYTSLDDIDQLEAKCARLKYERVNETQRANAANDENGKLRSEVASLKRELGELALQLRRSKR